MPCYNKSWVPIDFCRAVSIGEGRWFPGGSPPFTCGESPPSVLIWSESSVTEVTVSLSSMNLVYACSSIDPTSQSHQLTGEIWRILSSNFFVYFHEWFVSGMKLSQAWHEVEFVSKFSILHCDFFFRPGFHGVVDLMVLLRSSEFNQDLITWLQGFLGSKRETRNIKWQTSVLPPCQFNQQWKGNFIPVKFLGLSLSSVGWISDDTEEILRWHFSQ